MKKTSTRFKTIALILALSIVLSQFPAFAITTDSSTSPAPGSTNFIELDSSDSYAIQLDRAAALPSGDKLALSEITTITNNAGHYSNCPISYAADGNTATHWETNSPNLATVTGTDTAFTNYVTFTFNSIKELARVDYICRQDAGMPKGFPLKYKTYYSTSASGEDFQLLTQGGFSVPTGTMVTINFPPTSMRRLRFEFVEAHNDWASMAEMEFYKPDSTAAAVAPLIDAVFTDKTYSALSPEYSTAAQIQQVITQVSAYSNVDAYLYLLNEALSLVGNPGAFASKTFTSSQRGNYIAEQKRTLLENAQFSLDSTGYYVVPGETLYIYVDAADGDPLPFIGLGQVGMVRGEENQSFKGTSWLHQYQLVKGINVLEVPSYDKTGPAAVYIHNNAYPSEQQYAPRIRISGGKKFPYYVEGVTNYSQFVSELRTYVENISTNEDADFGGTTPTNKNYNIAEFCSENVTLTTSATGALAAIDAYPQDGTLSDVMQSWEFMWDEFGAYAGYDTVNENSFHYRPRGKFICRVLTCSPGVGGFCTTGYTAYNGTADKTSDSYAHIIGYDVIKDNSWIYYHEIGHSFENQYMCRVEITNNLFSVHMQDIFLEENRLCTDGTWKNNVQKYHNTKEADSDFFFQTAIIYQLELLYGDDLYPQACRMMRENKNYMFSNLSEVARLATAFSLAAGVDLTPHFAYYNLEVSDVAKEITGVDALPQTTKKTYYATNLCKKSSAKAFSNTQAAPSVEIYGGQTVSLKLDMGTQNNAVLCYEIYRDGQYAGITYSNIFTDETAETSQPHTYTVIAYDQKLNTSAQSTAVASVANVPLIQLSGDIIVAKQANLNPLNYVTAIDSLGNNITSSVTVTQNTVNTSETGTYSVTYSVTDSRGNSIQYTAPVTVVDNMAYLSDLNWETATVGWGSIRKDLAVSGNPLKVRDNTGNVRTVTKGLGTHAISEITYDLSNTDYTQFRTYMAPDQSPDKSASVSFEIYLDGVKAYDSGNMVASDVQQLASLDIKNVNKLKLVVTNGGNGNNYDHGDWIDAMLIKDETAYDPTLPLVIDNLSCTTGNNGIKTFTAETSGGAHSKTYSWYVIGDGQVYEKSAYSLSNSYSFTPPKFGNYTLILYCKDELGQMVTQKINFNI